jgi:N-formylglutamate deformylase
MQIYQLHGPDHPRLPIVANLPHSGLFVPDEIAEKMTDEHRRSLPNSDWHLDKLYTFLPTLGITVLQATHSRYVVDLNRALNTSLFGNFWTSVVPETTAFGQQIYQIQPTESEIQQRIETFYLPYHQTLKTILDEQIRRFGFVYLLDLHSFLGLIDDQICLGNQDGRTCSAQFMTTVHQAFRASGYHVVRNKVFKGGYITKHYGQMPNVGALQIEVRYPVYLKADQLDKREPPDWDVPELSIAQEKFQQVFEAIVNFVRRKIA